MPTTIQITTSLPTHIPKGSDHQPPNGGQPRDSLGISSHGGDPLKEPPFNPPVGSFGWPTPYLHMLYHHGINHLLCNLFQNQPPAAIQKLQYPIYVKDTDPNVHIRVFKKAIKTNGETLEANIMNLFGFTLRDNIFERGENYVQDHPNCIFKELEQALASNS